MAEGSLDIADVYIDELRHPDPAGANLLSFIDTVESHISAEAASIQTYHRLVRQTSDPFIRVVMDLLIQDEARHHALPRQIAENLRAELTWSPESPPSLTDEAPDADGPTAVEVRGLEAEERRGAEELRDLAQRQRRGDAELVCLLLEAMAMDSDKHARLLSFVARRLDRQGGKPCSAG
jgi:rubrerythrin